MSPLKEQRVSRRRLPLARQRFLEVRHDFDAGLGLHLDEEPASVAGERKDFLFKQSWTGGIQSRPAPLLPGDVQFRDLVPRHFVDGVRVRAVR